MTPLLKALAILASFSATLLPLRAAMAADIVAELAPHKRAIAEDLGHQYQRIAPLLRDHINHYQLSIDATTLMQIPAMQNQILKDNDRQIRDAKGLESLRTPLVRVRMANASMVTAWQQGAEPLFAYAPDGDDQHWQYIEAFDSRGQIHRLDAQQQPDRPVFVVELDGRKAMQAGLAVMRDAFTAAGEAQSASRLQVTPSTDRPLSTTLLSSIELNDDQEPWISGKAEVYAIVTGVDPSRDEPVLDIVDLPYLDYDGTRYSPNQVLIHWQRYRWAAADVLLMEHDDGTNYKTLAAALLTAATEILRLIPDPEVQAFAVIPQITNGILNAMPDSWFTNDDDYVDVYYTLFEHQHYLNHRGASNNATATFTPQEIAPR